MAQAIAPHTARVETITYGNFRSIITGEDPTWQIGGFSLPDGTEWKYREPNATVIVEHTKLRVRASPLSRSHDRIQVLDNAKHMYFSTTKFILSVSLPKIIAVLQNLTLLRILPPLCTT